MQSLFVGTCVAPEVAEDSKQPVSPSPLERTAINDLSASAVLHRPRAPAGSSDMASLAASSQASSAGGGSVGTAYSFRGADSVADGVKCEAEG